MFHYKKGAAYNTSADSAVLYQEVPSNTLLNDVFCYFVHNLPKFQNMHPYRITPGTDIAEHVGTTYPALPGPPAVPETYLFSKELVAYLETLIAFSCYYRADDGRMAGKMEQFYLEALTRYKGFKYPDFHAYIARKMTAWYKQFPFHIKGVEVEDEAEGEGGEPEVGDVVAAPAVLADGASGGYAMSPPTESGDEGGEGAGIHDGDALLEGETAADNVAAVAEGEARLAAAANAAAGAAAAPAAAAGP
jgi:hypothetical protein